MKVIAKANFAGHLFSAITGQVLDLPEDIANDLIKSKLAETAEVSNEDKRNNTGSDTKSAQRKRSSAKSNRS